MTLQQLIDIVHEAAQYMKTDSFEVTQKEGYSNIVTTSDVAVQQFLCRRLAEALPGSCFICEEDDGLGNEQQTTDNEQQTTDNGKQTQNNGQRATDYMQRTADEPAYWIIDPIDGTANYSRGIDQCAISVGLKVGDDMEMGVVYIPATGETFSAKRGEGAFLNGKRIHVSSRPFANSILCTALPVYHKEHADECADIIRRAFQQCNDIRRFGAAAPELCYLAMGRVELYFEYLLSAWDFAAASLIVKEAGGVVTDLRGAELSCLKGSGVVAANSLSNLEQLLSLVEPVTCC